MISDSTVVRIPVHNVSVDLASESVILDTDSGVYFGLNEVGRRIWQLLSSPQQVCAVQAALVREFDVEPEQCRSDLLRFLQDLADRGLIEVVDDDRG